MNWALWRKNIVECRWLLAACMLYVFGFSVLRVFIVSQFDTNRFKAILDLIPDTFKSFTPVDFEWVVSYTGRIALTFDEPMLVGCIALWAIARGSDAVSGELSRGTMEMLLAQPVSRRSVFFTQSVVTVGGIVMICLATWLGLFLGVMLSSVEESAVRTPLQSMMVPVSGWLRDSLGFVSDTFGVSASSQETRTVLLRQQVNCWEFWPGVLNLLSFGFFLAGFTAFCSALDRHRWRTIGIVTGIYTVMAMIKFAAMSLRGAGWCLWFTVFTFFEPEQAIERVQKPGPWLEWLRWGPDQMLLGTGATLNNVALLAMGIVCYLAGARVFSRRDLPAPL